MPIISVKNIKKTFSDDVPVLKGISFDVEHGLRKQQVAVGVYRYGFLR